MVDSNGKTWLKLRIVLMTSGLSALLSLDQQVS
jgi:hypothetical protein